MSYNDIDGEQEAERPVVFRGRGKSNVKWGEFLMCGAMTWFLILYAVFAIMTGRIDKRLTALELQAEQTGISAARDTQRIEALLTKQDELIRYRNADIYDDITRIENKRPYADSMLPTATQDCGGDCHE